VLTRGIFREVAGHKMKRADKRILLRKLKPKAK
jgi:hypothetical protein